MLWPLQTLDESDESGNALIRGDRASL